MTPQERQLVDDLFDRLSQTESVPRDADAVAAIAQGLRKAPNAVYALVQTVLVQDEALRRANDRIQELEAANGPQQEQAGGFLGSMRDALFGQQNQPRGSMPNVPPPDVGSRPVWNSGQAMPQAGYPGRYDQPPYGQAYGGGQPGMGPGMGGGGSFLGTAAATAAGMVGGSLLLNSIRSMMGGSQHGFGDASTMSQKVSGQNPWTDQSGSSLARDAGVNDIGSSSSRNDDNTRSGLFDSASIDDDHGADMDGDADDFDGGDFDGGGDSEEV
jgi:uncharacterized protein